MRFHRGAPRPRRRCGASRSSLMATAPHAVSPLARTRWYLNRLRCMPLAEVPFRVARTVKTHAERWLAPLEADAPPPDLRRSGNPWIRARPAISPARYVLAANRLVAGKIDVFALRGVDLGTPPQWNPDPKTGTEGPARFAMLLDYRDARLVGDVKYLWEVN